MRCDDADGKLAGEPERDGTDEAEQRVEGVEGVPLRRVVREGAAVCGDEASRGGLDAVYGERGEQRMVDVACFVDVWPEQLREREGEWHDILCRHESGGLFALSRHRTGV